MSSSLQPNETLQKDLNITTNTTNTTTQNSLQASLSPSSAFKYQDSKVAFLPVSSLLYPDQHTEKVLNDLTLDELSLIEKTIQKVKKKKSKEFKKQNNNNFNATIPPLIDESLSLSNINNDSTTEINKSNIKSQSSQFIVQQNHHSQNNHLDVNQQPLQDQYYQKHQIYVQQQQPNHHHLQSQQQQQQQHPSQIFFSQPQTEIQNPPLTQRNSSDQLTTITQIPNHALPATDPVFEICDGIRWIKFSYSVKGHNKDYRIRVDIENINVNEMNDQFKIDNCLYPRANCTEDKYKGNRWSYENECNMLGWKLSWINKDELHAKRGLLQRAVDSYRNRDPKLRSRRVVRNEKIMKGTLRKRNVRDEGHDGGLSNNNSSVKRQRAGSIKDLIIETYDASKIKLRADIETVNLTELTDDFKKHNCLYPGATVPESEYQGNKWDLETTCNELGWKLAHLNPQIHNNRQLLQKTLDMYCEKFIPEFRPRKVKTSHDLSAKFFETYPCENTVIPTSEKSNNNNNTLSTTATTSSSVTISNGEQI